MESQTETNLNNLADKTILAKERYDYFLLLPFDVLERTRWKNIKNNTEVILTFRMIGHVFCSNLYTGKFHMNVNRFIEEYVLVKNE